MNLNLKDYEEVKDRIPRFLTKYPDGRIITEMINISNNYELVVFKAYLYKDSEDQAKNIPLSTGYAHERMGSGYVNKTSHIENCETSSIGRALANIGFHGDKRPSLEEMKKVESHKRINEDRGKKSFPEKIETEEESIFRRFKINITLANNDRVLEDIKGKVESSKLSKNDKDTLFALILQRRAKNGFRR